MTPIGAQARQLGVLQRTAAERAQHRASENVISHLRSDYMLHEPTSSLLQVEINTIGVSFACLGSKTAGLHRHLLGRLGGSEADAERLPGNEALTGLVDAIGAAVRSYEAAARSAEARDSPAVVVMVVQPGERNLYDQQWVQLGLWERHGVRTLRRTLAQLAAQAALAERRGDGARALTVDGERVAVVYYRAGYVPDDYLDPERDWAARELVERSDAFKLPSVAYQLAGAKKVQQDLATPGRVEAFFAATATDAEAARERGALVRSFFAGQWAPGEPEAHEAVADALARPEAYVLKPQREGGGHNLYGAALRAKLAEGGEALGAYVLMQRIAPPIHRAVLLRDGAAREADTLSELGVYSVLVRQGGRIVLSQGAGHLVRTKTAESDEGGVAAGYGVLDSPILV